MEEKEPFIVVRDVCKIFGKGDAAVLVVDVVTVKPTEKTLFEPKFHIGHLLVLSV